MATGSTPPMSGLTGQDDVSLENAHAVGDVQTIFTRAFDKNRYLRDEIVQMHAHVNCWNWWNLVKLFALFEIGRNG